MGWVGVVVMRLRAFDGLDDDVREDGYGDRERGEAPNGAPEAEHDLLIFILSLLGHGDPPSLAGGSRVGLALVKGAAATGWRLRGAKLDGNALEARGILRVRLEEEGVRAQLKVDKRRVDAQ